MMHRRVRWGVRFVMIGLVPDHLARPQHAAILYDSAARGENGDYIGDEGPRQRQQPLTPAIAERGERRAPAEPSEPQPGGDVEHQAPSLSTAKPQGSDSERQTT